MSGARVGKEEAAAITEAFWAELDAQIALKKPTPATSKRILLTVVRDAVVTIEKSTGSESHAVADWTGVLDTISSATGVAHEHETGLHARAVAEEVLITDLKLARQEVMSLSALLERTQAQAETVMRALQAQADAHIREAEERVLAAELRAALAEDWLRRIEQASRSLLPNDRCTAV